MKKTPIGHVLQAEMRVITLAMRLKRDPSQWGKFVRACKDLKQADAAFRKLR